MSMIASLFTTLGLAATLQQVPVGYVWDFQTTDGGATTLTEQLTAEFEVALIARRCVTVLERRDVGRLAEQIQNEKALREFLEIPPPTRDRLLGAGANAVIFGEVVDDVGSGEIRIQTILNHFDGRKQAASVRLRRGLQADAASREQKMEELAGLLCERIRGPEAVESSFAGRWQGVVRDGVAQLVMVFEVDESDVFGVVEGMSPWSGLGARSRFASNWGDLSLQSGSVRRDLIRFQTIEKFQRPEVIGRDEKGLPVTAYRDAQAVRSYRGTLRGDTIDFVIDVDWGESPARISMTRAQPIRLGVRVTGVSAELAASLKLEEPYGAVLSEVEAGGPAEENGLRVGDVILKWGSATVTGPDHFVWLVRRTVPDYSISAAIVRDGRARTLQVTLRPVSEGA